MSKNNPSQQATHPLLYAFIGVLIFAGAAYAGYTFIPYLRDMSVETPKPVVTTPVEPVPQEPVEQPATPGTEDRLSVNWQVPEKIEALPIYQSENTADYIENSSYYRVGTVASGEYKDGEVIVCICQAWGMSFYPDQYRFIRTADKIIMLANHSTPIWDDGYGFDKTTYTLDEHLVIPELKAIPAQITGPAANQRLVRDPYPVVMFSTEGLVESFKHPLLGQVYMTAGYPAEYVAINNRHGFYAKAADGTTLVYSATFDFVPESVDGSLPLADITFNDGQKNDVYYDFTVRTGCGSATYAQVIDPAVIKMTDLVVVGKTGKGGDVYGYADAQHPDLKDIYEHSYIYLPEGMEKLPYETFVQHYPVIFVRDSFGRLIKGVSSEFQPAAECGKPVIYLYPEQTTKVSVQVEPQGGFSYTDPAYGEGWKVIATPEGKLTEVSSDKTYPYLFWEGNGGMYETPKKGFVVKQADVELFLVESLAKLGLNEQETADFNEFWLPKMQGSPYYFVTFLGNRAMDQLAPLTVEPKPDTVIRVLMDFTPLDAPIEVEGYELRAPERKGFTVVEWGGVLR